MVQVEAPSLGWRDRPITLTRWANLITPGGGQRTTITWDTLIRWVATPAVVSRAAFAREVEKKDVLGGWSPGACAGDYRKGENALFLDALILDFDLAAPTPPTVDAVAAAWSGYAGVLHTTKKHMMVLRAVDEGTGEVTETPLGPRCRVILPTLRPLRPEELLPLWTWAQQRMAGRRLKLDDAPKSPAQFWYDPVHLADLPYAHKAIDGDLLDPDLVLEEMGSGEASDSATKGAVGAFLAESRAYRKERPPEAPSASIEVLLAEIANCPAHGRNVILSRNAFFVFQRVDQGEIDEDAARALLYKAAEDCAQKTNRGDVEDLTEVEIRSTIERARRDAAAKPRPAPELHVVKSPVERAMDGFAEADYAAGFVLEHGEVLRYPADEEWLIWDGRRWGRERVSEVSAKKLALKFTRDVVDAANKIEDEDFAVKAYARSKGAQSHGFISGFLALAAHEDGVRIPAGLLDKERFKLTCLNGTVDLKKGDLLPFDKGDHITHLVPTAYDPEARCPRWEQFLDEVMLGRAGLIDFLHKWVGYCLTGDVTEQCFVLATGDGRNGKGTLAETLRFVVGPDLATPQPPRLLLTSRHGNERHPTELKVINHRRVIFVSEVKKGAEFDDERLKLLTGGDAFMARGMREDFHVVEPTAKLWLYVNDMPSVSDQTDAFWRRVRRVPFDAKFRENRCDPNLLEKLQSEAPGILAWAVRGCLLWQAQRLPLPPEVILATREYQHEQDTYQRFVEEYEAAGKKVVGTSTGELFQAFVVWSQKERLPATSQMTFAFEMRRLGYEAGPKTKHTRFWQLAGSGRPRESN